LLQPEHLVQLNEDAPRCPQCGKRISAEMSACPACGYELLPHRRRIRCKRCGSRIPADLSECPRCGADPRVGRLPPLVSRIAVVVIGVLLVVCVGWVVFRAITTNVLTRAFQSNAPTRVTPQVVHVIYVIATPVPPTPTRAPSPTPTVRVTPSPTRRGARALTPTPLAPPPASSYPAVAALAPAHMTVYSGANAVIVLEWQASAPAGLRENEWYEIRLTFTARDGAPGERKSYSKETRWIVANALYREISADARTFNWSVRVVRVEGIDPLSSPSRAYISPAGVTRVFIWN